MVAREDLGSGGSDHHALATVFEVDTGGSLAGNVPLQLCTAFMKQSWHVELVLPAGYQQPAVPSQDGVLQIGRISDSRLLVKVCAMRRMRTTAKRYLEGPKLLLCQSGAL